MAKTSPLTDEDRPEGCKRDDVFVTQAEFAYIVNFASVCLATGKFPNESGFPADELNKNISRFILHISKIKLQDCLEESRILPFRPRLPVHPPNEEEE